MLSQYRIVAVLMLTPLSVAVADCSPTPHRTTGTHYEGVTVHKIDISRGVVVSGRILSAFDCSPVPNARISHWQADSNGEYADRLRAFLYSNINGYYKFETEWPNLPVPHIHFIVTAEGHEKLETQWVGNQMTENIEFDIVLTKKQ